ncbi:unnamed protein product [Gordionus sp. m RMFG-2023]
MSFQVFFEEIRKEPLYDLPSMAAPVITAVYDRVLGKRILTKIQALRDDKLIDDTTFSVLVRRYSDIGPNILSRLEAESRSDTKENKSGVLDFTNQYEETPQSSSAYLQDYVPQKVEVSENYMQEYEENENLPRAASHLFDYSKLGKSDYVDYEKDNEDTYYAESKDDKKSTYIKPAESDVKFEVKPKPAELLKIDKDIKGKQAEKLEVDKKGDEEKDESDSSSEEE